jgi:hypothetical protein
MKTPIELRVLYKTDTGIPFKEIEYAMDPDDEDNDLEWRLLTISQYIEWLEGKVTELTLAKV